MNRIDDRKLKRRRSTVPTETRSQNDEASEMPERGYPRMTTIPTEIAAEGDLVMELGGALKLSRKVLSTHDTFFKRQS